MVDARCGLAPVGEPIYVPSMMKTSLLPPILVRRGVDRLPDVMVSPWSSPDPSFVGRRQCELAAPGGSSVTGHLDLPDPCGPVEAWTRAASLLGKANDPASLWLDTGPYHPTEALPRGEFFGGLALEPLAGAGGRVFRVIGEPGTRGTYVCSTSCGDGVEMVTRVDDLLCSVTCRSSGGVGWTVLPGLGAEAAYWGFTRNEVFAAAALLARQLVDEAVDGHVTPGTAVVVGHSAVRLRQLGPAYRAAAKAVLDRHGTDDLDVACLRLFLTPPNDDGLARAVESLCERLLQELPVHTEILRLLYERLPASVEHGGVEGRQPTLVREALHKVRHAAGRTLWDHVLRVAGDGAELR